jgi:hypothetical protein
LHLISFPLATDFFLYRSSTATPQTGEPPPHAHIRDKPF